MSMKSCCIRVLSLLFVVAVIIFAAEEQTLAQKNAVKKLGSPAFAPEKDDPALPRVLLIGDSISIGYTLPVQAALAGKANVHRIPANGGPTTLGIARIDKWLGDGRWDVIHFNWGLHDLKFIGDKRQVPLDQYERNLRKLVKRLKQTKAKLIWCTTTPVPDGVSPKRIPEDVAAYNAAAKKIMDQEGVAIDDLYDFALPKLQNIQLRANVHYNGAGYRVLGEQVAASILKALEKPASDK